VSISMSTTPSLGPQCTSNIEVVIMTETIMGHGHRQSEHDEYRSLLHDATEPSFQENGKNDFLRLLAGRFGSTCPFWNSGGALELSARLHMKKFHNAS
jgi:hypothetical protein